jgi:hypothetical protein
MEFAWVQWGGRTRIGRGFAARVLDNRPRGSSRKSSMKESTSRRRFPPPASPPSASRSPPRTPPSSDSPASYSAPLRCCLPPPLPRRKRSTVLHHRCRLPNRGGDWYFPLQGRRAGEEGFGEAGAVAHSVDTAHKDKREDDDDGDAGDAVAKVNQSSS